MIRISKMEMDVTSFAIMKLAEMAISSLKTMNNATMAIISSEMGAIMSAILKSVEMEFFSMMNNVMMAITKEEMPALLTATSSVAMAFSTEPNNVKTGIQMTMITAPTNACGPPAGMDLSGINLEETRPTMTATPNQTMTAQKSASQLYVGMAMCTPSMKNVMIGMTIILIAVWRNA